MAIDPSALFATALNIDPKRTKFLYFGFLVLALSIYLANYLVDANIPFWSIPIYLMVFSVIIGALAQIDGMLKHVLSWGVVLLFIGWLSVLMLQVATQSFYAPPLATALCLVDPFQDRCGFNAAAAGYTRTNQASSKAPGQSSQNTNPSNGPDVLIQAAFPVTHAHASKLRPTMVDEVRPDDNQVFIQFAVLARQDVVGLATKLVGLGWQVQGADSGGERLAAADGLMEVRYFYAGDQPRANLLAQTVSSLRPGNPPVSVQDLSATGLARNVPPGHFEIWMSK